MVKHIERRFVLRVGSIAIVKDIKDFLTEIDAPDNANLSVSVTQGDRPWESDEARIEVNW